ncbi:MAG: hypothetical protein JOZ69_22405, partial [Myxococcales bacterium]|nr:hypothetical protein [Myxococcales bacterium]
HDLLAALPPEATEAARAALPGAAELERYVSFAANDVGAALAGAAGVEGEAGAARSTEGA